MADQDINILVRLKDQFSVNAAKLNTSIKSIGENLDGLSRQMRQAGINMQYLGSAVTGAFGVALHTASTYSIQAKATMDKFTLSLLQLQVTVATAVLPVIDKLANTLAGLVQWFQRLDPVVREHYLNMALLGGIWLTVGGTVMRTGAAIAKVMAIVFKNPAILVGIALIAVFAKYWEQIRVVVIEALNSIERFFDATVVGLTTLFSFILGVIEKVYTAMIKLNALLSYLPGFMGQYFKDTIPELQSAKQALDDLRVASDKTMTTFSEKFDALNKPGATGFLSGIVEDLEKLPKLFDNLGKSFTLPDLVPQFDALKAVAQGTAQAMSQAFGNLFFNVFTGQLSNIKTVFSDFGKQILQILSQAMAKFILVKTIGAAFPSFGKFFHQGGIIKAHSGLAVDEVPIVAQTGEGVLSRKGMSALGRNNFDRLNAGEGIGGGSVTNQPIVVIQAWDTQDLMRNSKTIEAIIANALRKNTGLRGVVKNV
ncbi:MAG TPA: hypothetical protein PKL77_10100 [Candidatus Omnitrophota bacterium]|nr:hypothetical protein [Candidatus Omnitrophota bacterium]